MLLRHFFVRGGVWFLLGFLRKNGCSAWCFCGQFVVKRVDNVDSGMTRFRRSKILQRFQLYLSTGLRGGIVGI